jgi:NADH-quinone oxidoreductase subunit J
MNVVDFLFYFFEVLAVASAACIVFSRNVFYGALYLIVCLLCIAALYVLSGAEFLAVTQILIYVGGVLVVIIFGVMLTSRITGKPLVVENGYKFSGTLVAVALAGLLIFAFAKASFTLQKAEAVPNGTNIKAIGIGFMTNYLLPFEIAGVLLLMALIGAIVVSSSAKSDQT